MQVTIDFPDAQQATMVAHALEAVAQMCQDFAASRGEVRPTNAGLIKATVCAATATAIRDAADCELPTEPTTAILARYAQAA